MSPTFSRFQLGKHFISKYIFIVKTPTDFGKTVENGVDKCLNLQELAIVRLNVGTSDCESRTFLS